jgi:hypothetical protein
MNDNTIDLSSQRYLNESAIRAHALRCSAKFKVDRFSRVSQDFVDEVKADVEALLRALRAKAPTQIFDPLPPDETFVTGLLRDRAGQLLDDWVARIIQNKVQRQPSCGKTLGRTR